MKKLLFSLLFLFAANLVSGQQFILKGVTSDKQNNTLPFTSIYIQGTTKGTSANTNGEYQFKLEKGHYTLIFKAVGYNQLIKQIDISADMNLSVVMEAEVYQLKDVVIKANSEDPLSFRCILTLLLLNNCSYRSMLTH